MIAADPATPANAEFVNPPVVLRIDSGIRFFPFVASFASQPGSTALNVLSNTVSCPSSWAAWPASPCHSLCASVFVGVSFDLSACSAGL